MNIFLLIVAILSIIGMSYSYAKFLYVNRVNFDKVKEEPRKFLVNVLKLSAYMASGGICFSIALTLILTIVAHDVDFLGLLACLVPLMIFLSIVYAMGYVWRAGVVAGFVEK